MKLGVFDIVGPIMIGPSSSHTAEPFAWEGWPVQFWERILARRIFFCNSSFAQTCKGHGTDLALVAGLRYED